eukprot:6192450-Pleurochrysis_carterae.AAC.4
MPDANFDKAKRLRSAAFVAHRYDQVLEGPVPTPPGMAHAVGGRRVRLLSARPGDPAKLAQLSSQESTQANSASSAPPTSDNTNESTGTTRSGECLKIQMADVEVCAPLKAGWHPVCGGPRQSRANVDLFSPTCAFAMPLSNAFHVPRRVLHAQAPAMSTTDEPRPTF